MTPATHVTSSPAASCRLLLLCLVGYLSLGPGCASRRPTALQFDAVSVQLAETHTTHTSVALATHRPEDEHSERRTSGNQQPLEILEVNPADSLASLEARAQSWNPRLLQLGHKVAAAEAKADYIDKLPDPTIGTNIFAHPIETASGSQRANLTATQMIPWLKRLDAQSQQAWLEALALRQVYEAERLQVVGDVRTLWYRLYLLGKQLETNRANLEVLRPLVAVANDRVATGAGSARDAWLGNLELGKLGERILTLNQQLESTKAELNLVIGRDTDHPISVPQMLEPSLPDWTHGMLRQIALQQQPEITAAQLQAQATSLGIEVARLKRRPNFSLSASWFAIDDNRPTPSFVDVGRDAWSIGAQMSIPLWPHKYDSIEEEAMWKHSASHASVEEVMRRYDSRLRDLWERAKTAAETAELYKTSLLPQARLALDAGIDSYSNSRVDLDSIVRDFRSLLMLELGYHRAVSELAVALARIQQAVGTDLAIQLEAAPLPAPDEP